jgi:hypothetical protein
MGKSNVSKFHHKHHNTNNFSEMNITKLTSVLSQSSRVFIPVDDPCDVTFNQAAEVVKACLEITFFQNDLACNLLKKRL